jgi:hypothetical protein
VTNNPLHTALEQAIIPPVPEIQEAFLKNRKWLQQSLGI